MSCNKEKFDLKTAKTILNLAKNKHKKYRKECRYYFCEECKSHHLTSMSEFDEKIEIPLEDLQFSEEWKKLMK